jgi:hypothetical protein
LFSGGYDQATCCAAVTWFPHYEAQFPDRPVIHRQPTATPN